MMKRGISIVLSLIISLQVTLLCAAEGQQPQQQQQLSQDDFEKQRKMLSVTEKDPYLFNAALVEIECDGNTEVVRVSNKGKLDIKGIGEVDVAGKRVSEVEDWMFKRYGVKFTFHIRETRLLVSVLGAANEQGFAAPGNIPEILAQCRGVNWAMSNGMITVFDPQVGKAKRYSYTDLMEGKKKIWVNAGSYVDVQPSGGVHFEAGVAPYLRTISYLITILGAMSIGYAAGRQ
jgi:hypothetical protein